jgi:hypothetical protein
MISKQLRFGYDIGGNTSPKYSKIQRRKSGLVIQIRIGSEIKEIVFPDSNPWGKKEKKKIEKICVILIIFVISITERYNILSILSTNYNFFPEKYV